MRKIILVIALCICGIASAHAQTSGLTAPPPPVCSASNAGALYTQTSTSPNTVWTCSYYNLQYQWVVNPMYGGLIYYPIVPNTCSGAVPVFLAGYPSTTMYVCIQGVPTAVAGGGVNNITSLTGDVTATGPGAAAATVTGINGAAIQASINVLSTNASKQIVGATYQNVVNLWTSCTSGYLQYNGTCSTPSPIPTGTTNQLLYYAAGGTTVTPLTLGTNLSITGGTLNVGDAGFVLLNPTSTQTIAQPANTGFNVTLASPSTQNFDVTDSSSNCIFCTNSAVTTLTSGNVTIGSGAGGANTTIAETYEDGTIDLEAGGNITVHPGSAVGGAGGALNVERGMEYSYTAPTGNYAMSGNDHFVAAVNGATITLPNSNMSIGVGSTFRVVAYPPPASVDVVPGSGTGTIDGNSSYTVTGSATFVYTGSMWLVTQTNASTTPGSVTSVALSLPSIFNVSGSPVTTTGTLTGTLANQTANTVFAGPPTGSAATPTFRPLTTADMPGGVPVSAVTYGAVGDAIMISDAAVTAGSTTLTSASSSFTSADTGKTAIIPMGPQAVYMATTTASATVTGNTNQYCTATISGGTTNAVGYLYLSSGNTIASGGIVYIQSGQYGSGFTSAPTSATLTNGSATCSGTVAITSSLFALPVITTVTYASATTLTMATAATTTGSSLWVEYGTNNTASLQNAVNAVSASHGTLYIPTGAYLINGSLSVPSSVTIKGDGALPDYGPVTSGGTGAYTDVFPSKAPFLRGTTLVEVDPGVDAIDVQVVGGSARLSNFGILFAPAIAFLNTGDGINATSSTTQTYGQMDGEWDNIRVWGTDGNHYAFSFENANYWTGNTIGGYGGGGIQFLPDTSAPETGNATLINPYFITSAGGNASGYNISGNLYAFVRPQSNLSPINSDASSSVLSTWPVPPVNPYTQSNIQASTATQLVMVGQDFEANSFNGVYPSNVYPSSQFANISADSTLGALFPSISIAPTYTGTCNTETQLLWNSSGYGELGLPCNNAEVTLWSNGHVGVAGLTSAPTDALGVGGSVGATQFHPTTIYSAAGTALPTCTSGIVGTEAVVSDATSPSYMGAYTSGGAVTTAVICSYNGTTYSWLTH